MRVLGIVTARGGSKGIPNKNLVDVNGHPLLWYTIDAALKSTSIARTVISTDAREIADIATEMGAECPFMRPSHLAQDDTPTLPVLQDVVRRLADEGDQFDAIFTLQPTNPLRIVSDIDGAVRYLKSSGGDSVIGFSEVGERHPARMKSIGLNGEIIDPYFAEKTEGLRRQDLPKLYLRNGAVYVTRTPVLMNKNSIKGDTCFGWIIPTERSVNIDEPFDLFLTRHLLQLDLEDFPGHCAGKSVG